MHPHGPCGPTDFLARYSFRRPCLFCQGFGSGQGLEPTLSLRKRPYRLHARYWIDDLGGDVPTDQQRIAITAVKEVAAGKDISLRLVLSRTLLASEER